MGAKPGDTTTVTDAGDYHKKPGFRTKSSGKKIYSIRTSESGNQFPTSGDRMGRNNRPMSAPKTGVRNLNLK